MTITPDQFDEYEELCLIEARAYSTIEARPWGVLLHNAANPDHNSANNARQIRSADPEATIDEIIAFYRQLGLTPRVQIDDMTQPTDMVERLVARGFVAHLEQA